MDGEKSTTRPRVNFGRSTTTRSSWNRYPNRNHLSAASVAVLLGLATSLTAQSSNAFGRPTETAPNPAATIAAVPGSRGQGWLGQGRSEVLARHGIVATSDPLAAQAGLEILRRGGNAMDAAVAAGAVLDVTSQNDTGIGGDLFALVWVAEEKKLYALNSAGWAPAGWTPEFFRNDLGLERMPGSGVNAATVPGAISGYDALLGRFGTLTFRETFQRAAQLAEEGWGQSERRHRDIVAVQEKLRGDPDSDRTFLQRFLTGPREPEHCRSPQETFSLDNCRICHAGRLK